MYCPECKNKILEGVATCHYCGTDLSKLRKIKLEDVEEEEEQYSNVNLDRAEIRDALTYDPFKEKIRYHMFFSVLTILLGIGILIITYFSLGLFSGTFSIVVSIAGIIVSIAGFVYAIICIIFFMR
jgi:hypothetical protein